MIINKEEKEAIEYLNNICNVADDCDKYATHIPVKYMKIWNKLISKQDKVIDLMAKYFYKGNMLKTNTLDEFKEYFYKQVEE